MKKRRIIIISCIIGVILVIIGVFAALFNLQTIRVEVLKNPEIIESMYGSSYQDQLIKSGEFQYGSNTLFSTYKENQQRIEKKYPFVKIQKLVRRFPDKMTIYITGRIPEAVIKDNTKTDTYYVVDIDMKVLDVISLNEKNNTDLYEMLPIINGGNISNKEAGDFIEKNNSTSAIVNILDGIYAKDKELSSVMSDITMDLSNEKVSIRLRDGNVDGALIKINGFKYLKEKVFAVFSVYKDRILRQDNVYEYKDKIQFTVGNDFVPLYNEKFTMSYDGESVNIPW